MTRDDIIRMARTVRDGGHWNQLDIVNFGLLVAAHERDECAYECEVRDGTFALKNAGKFFADIIRARGEA